MTPQEREVVRALKMGAEGALKGVPSAKQDSKLVTIKAVDLQTLVRLAETPALADAPVPDSPVA